MICKKTWLLLRSCVHVGDKPGHEAESFMGQEGRAAHRRNATSDIMLRSAKLQPCYWSPFARHSIRQHISTLFFSRSWYNKATLFTRLLCDQLQCQRTICTPSWGMEGQCKYSWEMRAPIHMRTEGKLLLYCSHHTEVHIVPRLSF